VESQQRKGGGRFLPRLKAVGTRAQKIMELRQAVRPEVRTALERAAAELAPDLEYLKDK
jgi:hypothetical protein